MASPMALRKLRELAIPLPGGIVVSLRLPIQLSEQQFDHLIASLELMREALTSEPLPEVIAQAELAMLYDLGDR